MASVRTVQFDNKTYVSVYDHIKSVAKSSNPRQKYTNLWFVYSQQLNLYDIRSNVFRGRGQRSTPVINIRDLASFTRLFVANSHMSLIEKRAILQDEDFVPVKCYIEEEIKEKLIKAFNTAIMQTQYLVGKYRIDYYFPEYNIAVECDEHGHKHYSSQREHDREQFIMQQLHCGTIIRFNPYDKQFSLESLVHDIKCRMSKKDCAQPTNKLDEDLLDENMDIETMNAELKKYIIDDETKREIDNDLIPDTALLIEKEKSKQEEARTKQVELQERTKQLESQEATKRLQLQLQILELQVKYGLGTTCTQPQNLPPIRPPSCVIQEAEAEPSVPAPENPTPPTTLQVIPYTPIAPPLPESYCPLNTGHYRMDFLYNQWIGISPQFDYSTRTYYTGRRVQWAKIFGEQFNAHKQRFHRMQNFLLYADQVLATSAWTADRFFAALRGIIAIHPPLNDNTFIRNEFYNLYHPTKPNALKQPVIPADVLLASLAHAGLPTPLNHAWRAVA